mgnify:FL=1
MIFKKKRKTMSERPEVSPAAGAADKAAQQGTTAQNMNDAIAAASEAASEHGLHDTDADSREDISELNSQLMAARADAADLKDKWLRLNAEFDNFRKRTAKERIDLIQFAGENTLKNLLPVLDDMDRAIANNEATAEIAVVKEGFHLIRSKLVSILGSQGVKAMPDAKGEQFDTDRHEAITKAPAPEPKLKGKVIDIIENGYTLHDKVIRYAKVIVGE